MRKARFFGITINNSQIYSVIRMPMPNGLRLLACQKIDNTV
jgi:hypothetical protein